MCNYSEYVERVGEIKGAIATYADLGWTPTAIADKLVQRFTLTASDVKSYVKKYMPKAAVVV